MLDNQQDQINRKDESNSQNNAGDAVKQVSIPDKSEEHEQSKEEWQRGISAGKHEKMNADNSGSSNPERSGSSSIPLDKEDTIGNP